MKAVQDLKGLRVSLRMFGFYESLYRRELNARAESFSLNTGEYNI
jgi:hypothetical protein